MQFPVSDAERMRLRTRPRALPVMRQRWRHLAFLHWSVDPAALARLLPPGVELDTWQGEAFVGVVPFAIRGSRAPFLPAIPLLSGFNELNLRTYVHRRGRDPGVWFFSLDAASRLAVWGARAAYKLPYYHASIALERSRSGAVSFSSRRTTKAGGPVFACSYQPVSAAAEAAPGTREFFLIERYLLYSWDRRRLRSARVWHAPYRFAPARVADLQQDLLAWARIDVGTGHGDAGEPIAHYADDVDVRIYAPASVREDVFDRLPVAVAARPQIQEAIGS